MKISLLVYEDAVLSALSGVIDLLQGVNGYLEKQGQPPAFEVELVGEKFRNIQLNGPAQFICFKTLDEVGHTDLIIVPAFSIEPEQALQKYSAITSWVQRRHRSGTEVASLCFGSYFLAEAGLLTGKPATSHWMAIDDMQRRYPQVKMLSDKVITDQDGVYTSGGAFSSLNLILYLIEKFCGRDVAIWTSKMFSIDMDRESRAHFAVFKSQYRHEDADITKAQRFIEQNYHSDISIEQIASQAWMSKRNFIRRFKTATQNTPLEYLQRVRIESAKKALEANQHNISSLIYDIGYNDLKTFRMLFKRFTGLTPKDYRNKYSGSAQHKLATARKDLSDNRIF